jgi:hypothetical protein
MQGRKKAMAIKQARPTHTVTLTLAGSDYATISKRVEKFRASMRVFYPSYEHCWSAEPNPSGDGGAHVHMYIRVGAESVSQFLVQEIWKVGRAAVQPMPASYRPAYTAYTMKTLADPEQHDRFLDLNSASPDRRYLVHTSRNFYTNQRRTP